MNSAFSQGPPINGSVISIAEDLAADDSDPEMAGLYIEKLYDLIENPVDINSDDPDELSRLFFLTDFQLKVIADYTSGTGSILSPYEIANLPGFDRETAIMMQSFIILTEHTGPPGAKQAWHNDFLMNINRRISDQDSLWQGSADKILAKYRFSAGGLTGGLTAEKDPGERLLSGQPLLPDMLSAHFSYKGKGVLKRFVIGDYSARFGQGTNINTGIRNYVSLYAPGTMSSKNEIRPYTASDENSFFRGAAAEISAHNISLILFWSGNRTDATTELSPEGNESVVSFYRSGLHNSASTMLKKDVLTDINYGVNVTYSFRNMRTGFTFSEERLSLPVITDDKDPEKVFSFNGSSNSLYSLHYSRLSRRLLLFGEITMNGNFKNTVIQGLTYRPADRLSLNLLFRNHEPGFHSLHGRGTGSPGYPHRSVTGNFAFEAARHLFISGGCEIIKYPWLRYNVSSPSYSGRMAARIRFAPSEKLAAEVTYSLNLSTSDGNGNNNIPCLEEKRIRSLTTKARYSVSSNFNLTSGMYFKRAGPAESKGTLLSQDLNYRLANIPLTFWLRFSIFSTADWDSRIYIYENDLYRSFSVPAMQGKGSKSYLMLSWKILKKAEIRFKYSVLSGITSSSINDNTPEYRFQFRISD